MNDEHKEKIYYIPAQGFVTDQYLCEKMTEVLEKAEKSAAKEEEFSRILEAGGEIEELKKAK